MDQAKNTFQPARDRASTSLGESKSQIADQFGTVADALRRTTEHLRWRTSSGSRSPQNRRPAGGSGGELSPRPRMSGYEAGSGEPGSSAACDDARRRPGPRTDRHPVFEELDRSRGARRIGQGRDGERRFGYTGYDQPFSGQGSGEAAMPELDQDRTSASCLAN